MGTAGYLTEDRPPRRQNIQENKSGAIPDLLAIDKVRPAAGPSDRQAKVPVHSGRELRGGAETAQGVRTTAPARLPKPGHRPHDAGHTAPPAAPQSQFFPHRWRVPKGRASKEFPRNPLPSPQVSRSSSPVGRETRRQNFFSGGKVPQLIAGWSSPVARQAHNLKAAGSNPAPATILTLCEHSVYKGLIFYTFRRNPAMLALC